MAKDKAEKNTCILYGDIIEYVEGDDALSDAQVAELFRVYLAYANGKAVKISDPEVKGIWRTIKSRVDKANANYAEKCERLKENAKNRYKSKQKDANACNCNNDIDSDYDVFTDVNTESSNDDSKEKGDTIVSPKKKTTKPTLDEVKAYAAEQGKPEEAEHFFDYYTANGWKVGKNPMKDWKAAFRNWKRSAYNKSPTTNSDAEWEAFLARKAAEDD